MDVVNGRSTILTIQMNRHFTRKNSKEALGYLYLKPLYTNGNQARLGNLASGGDVSNPNCVHMFLDFTIKQIPTQKSQIFPL